MLEQLFLKDCTPFERHMQEQGTSVRSPLPPEEKGAAEALCKEDRENKE